MHAHRSAPNANPEPPAPSNPSLLRAQVFCFPRDQAAKQLKISINLLKRVCRDYNIERWPYRKLQVGAEVSRFLDEGTGPWVGSGPPSHVCCPLPTPTALPTCCMPHHASVPLRWARQRAMPAWQRAVAAGAAGVGAGEARRGAGAGELVELRPGPTYTEPCVSPPAVDGLLDEAPLTLYPKLTPPAVNGPLGTERTGAGQRGPCCIARHHAVSAGGWCGSGAVMWLRCLCGGAGVARVL